jgi:hypothetical protein
MTLSSRVALAMLIALASSLPVAGQEVDTDAMIETAREQVSPIRRCKPAEDGTIVVCGDDTKDNRLSPELRDMAGVGRSTRDSIPPAPEARAMSLDKLPYSWMGRDGILYPRAKPNPLLEHVKAMEAARAAEEAAEAEAAAKTP